MSHRPYMSFTALEKYILGTFPIDTPGTRVEMPEGRVPPSVVANLCGVDRQTVHRWHLFGVPYYSADRAATALGIHPLNIWPDFYMEEELCLT